MSSSDPRELTIDERNNVHRSLAKARAERNDVRQSIEKAEAELQRLLFRRKKVAKNISQLKKTLVIHRILPTEIIGYIFSILRAAKVPIPYNQDITPPQITVSHVCSRWREIALATPALWNDVEIRQPDCTYWVDVALELLFDRAGTRGVNITLNMENGMEKIFQDIVLPLHVKKLHLTIPLSALENLSQQSADIIANIDEIALSFTFDSMVPIANQDSITPQFLSKIRSLTVLELGSQRSLVQRLDLPNLSWSQMRHLCCNISLTLSTVHDILRQSPLLDVCGIKVELHDDEAEPTTVLTLPQLRILHIFQLYHNESALEQEIVLRSFKCPNLTDFKLDIVHWSSETYKIIENNYNLRQLLRFDTNECPYPLSKVLFDAPMLQELALNSRVFLDARASQGIASGELGRCLTSLGFEGRFNLNRVLDMVISRQRHVKQVVEASRSWQDQQISSIKWVLLSDYHVEQRLAGELKGKRDELEELGVRVIENRFPVPDAESLDLRPLFSLYADL